MPFSLHKPQILINLFDVDANGRTNRLSCLLWISGFLCVCVCFLIIKRQSAVSLFWNIWYAFHVFLINKKKIEILHSNGQSIGFSFEFLLFFTTFFRWLIGISTIQKCLVLCFNSYWTSHLSIPVRLKQSENEHNRRDDHPKSRNQKKNQRTKMHIHELNDLDVICYLEARRWTQSDKKKINTDNS